LKNHIQWNIFCRGGILLGRFGLRCPLVSPACTLGLKYCIFTIRTALERVDEDNLGYILRNVHAQTIGFFVLPVDSFDIWPMT
jgi:hypothetical protein